MAVVDVDAAAADSTVALIAKAGGQAFALVADISDEEEIAAASVAAARRSDGLDIVVANAAIEPTAVDDRADRLEASVWRRIIDVNLTGTFLTCKHGVRRLLESEGGAVVCTASPTGLYGLAPGEDAYSASKAGVYGLIRVMANDYALRAIRVNGVLPGFIDTPLTHAVAPTSRSSGRRCAEFRLAHRPGGGGGGGHGLPGLGRRVLCDGRGVGGRRRNDRGLSSRSTHS